MGTVEVCAHSPTENFHLDTKSFLTEAFIEVDLTQIMLLLEQPEVSISIKASVKKYLVSKSVSVVLGSILGFELSTFHFPDQILVYDPTPDF